MAYTVKFQTEASYKNIKYGQGTIYSSACGPSSLCNALQALGLADVSIPTMCKLAVSCGARVSGGTVISTLLQYTADKYNFEYRATSKNAELLAHLKSGGVAILHGGSSHKLFSSGGHFVTAVAASGETITVLDSYWYSGKYTSTALRREKTKVISKGVIQTSLYQCGLATADRSPSYYLISKKQPKLTLINETMAVTTDKLNVRSGAGTSYSVIGSLSKGQMVESVGTTGSWYKIKYQNTYGYISAQYVKVVTVAPKEDDEVVESTLHRINGKDIKFDAITKNGITYSCDKDLCKALGFTLSYDSATEARVIDLDTIKVCVDGKDLEIPGVFVNGDTNLIGFALLREMGYSVSYDKGSSRVMIKSIDKV